LSAARNEPPLVGSPGDDGRLQGRSREPCHGILAGWWLAHGITDTDRAQTTHRPHLTRPKDVTSRRTGRRKDLDRGRLGLLPSPDPDALARLEGSCKQADVCHAFSRRRSLDLEHAAGQRAIRVADSGPQEPVEAVEQRIHADPSSR